MIGDPSGDIARRFGVRRAVFGHAKRVTFLVDAGGVIRGVFHHEVRIGRHVEEVRAALQALPAQPGVSP